ncbi:hypothetical protein SAMN03159406_00587 [Rhizobium sp. NFR03]|nr:hypothetical protein SAMN03159406_00587 [Rhizobium sp. NFR03]
MMQVVMGQISFMRQSLCGVSPAVKKTVHATTDAGSLLLSHRLYTGSDRGRFMEAKIAADQRQRA